MKKTKEDTLSFKVTNVSATALIFLGDPQDPSTLVLASIKDDEYPWKCFRGTVCPLGGNWIGEAAKRDANPTETLKRELREELVLDGKPRSTAELKDLGVSSLPKFHPAVSSQVMNPDDARLLAELAKQMGHRACALRSWVHVVPEEISGRPTIATLTFPHLIVLEEEDAEILKRLHATYGNLSNEAPTVLATLAKLAKVPWAFGHGQSYGINEEHRIPGIVSVEQIFDKKYLNNYQAPGENGLVDFVVIERTPFPF